MLCMQCDWYGVGGERLNGTLSFNSMITVMGCPRCKGVDFKLACDEPECWQPMTCGTPTPNGYRHTCRKHAPKMVGGNVRTKAEQKRKLIKVRISLTMNCDGEWTAYGCSDELTQNTWKHSQKYVIVAEVPAPVVEEFEGVVETRLDAEAGEAMGGES